MAMNRSMYGPEKFYRKGSTRWDVDSGLKHVICYRGDDLLDDPIIPIEQMTLSGLSDVIRGWSGMRRYGWITREAIADLLKLAARLEGGLVPRKKLK